MGTKNIAISIPEKLVERIEYYLKTLPGAKLSTLCAVLLEEGLDSLDKRFKTKQ